VNLYRQDEHWSIGAFNTVLRRLSLVISQYMLVTERPCSYCDIISSSSNISILISYGDEPLNVIRLIRLAVDIFVFLVIVDGNLITEHFTLSRMISAFFADFLIHLIYTDIRLWIFCYPDFFLSWLNVGSIGVNGSAGQRSIFLFWKIGKGIKGVKFGEIAPGAPEKGHSSEDWR